jgi:hypothetical protein
MTSNHSLFGLLHLRFTFSVLWSYATYMLDRKPSVDLLPPKTVPAPISPEEMEAARSFALEVIGEHQPIEFIRAMFMANQNPEINRFAFHDAVRLLGKEGIVRATGTLGYGELTLAE